MITENPDELLKRTLEFVENHRNTYLASGGVEGHLMDMSHVGVNGLMPTLLLETVGRKSGKRLIVPLIYGCRNGEWIVIGSKGGAPSHPAWYLNLQGQDTIRFQIGTQCFHGRWREPAAEERKGVWDYMVQHFPPFMDYQQSTGGRLIPVIMLRPEAPCPVFGC